MKSETGTCDWHHSNPLSTCPLHRPAYFWPHSLQCTNVILLEAEDVVTDSSSPVTGHMLFPAGSSQKKLQKRNLMSSALVTHFSFDQPLGRSRSCPASLVPQDQSPHQNKQQCRKSSHGGRRGGSALHRQKQCPVTEARGGLLGWVALC